jgi:KEOPS complex subunit Cgi121
MMRTCTIRQVRFDVPEINAFLGEIREIAERYATHIIFFDSDKMAGLRHVEEAIRHAKRAHESAACISNTFEMEALLYAAGSRQCNIAMQFGLHEGPNASYLCICPPSENAWNELKDHMNISVVKEDWETITSEKQQILTELFAITGKELAAAGEEKLRDLVLERVVLLEVYR